MAFTYDLVTNPPPPLTLIRFHLSDSDPTTPIWQDEEINMVINMVGTWQTAVIYLIQNMIAKIGQERQFQADWLTTGPGMALQNWQVLLMQKRRLFGIPELAGGAVHVYRPDSGQSAEPDYTNIQNGDYNAYDPYSSISGFGW